ncbi:MAG TPA: glycosidase [Candidatus Bathyarchaeota archaeon]|nr:glycosidase [Candidatus Bathyarchaeota archaeon]
MRGSMSGSGPPGWREVEEALWAKVERGLRELRGLRKPDVNDVFERVLYLGPSDFYVTNYFRRFPIEAFNPGAALEGDRLFIFVRLIFEFYGYVSSVGLAEVSIDDVLEGRVGRTPLPTRIVLWPKELWEQLGCEDPRVLRLPGRWLILYCGRGYYWLEDKMVRTDALALAELDDDFNVLRRGYFSVRRGEAIWAPSNRDSAFLSIEGREATLATRPVVRGTKLCWCARADLEALEMPEEELRPVMVPEEWESHMGWSTNAVKLSSNELLIGWHGVSRADLAYRNGLAVLSPDGELLAVSDYVLSPRGMYEEYGDRCMTLFGNGLVRYKEWLIWVGGVCDACVGIFKVELDKALETLRWLKG